ncbi:16S rRNA (cytosine(1402)-N(4))-methyltransferase RsmH [Patescibacteria group bacterium]|nr:16S rRNA (cytosine(1402)-N(4))-methyltransferase RsmH [Patescibacteria group bacterium]
MEYHKPVLLSEVIAHLKPERGKKFIDATLGDGGHTVELLKCGAEVLGIDYNEQSLERAISRVDGEGLGAQFTSVLGNFKNIDKIAEDNNFKNVDGVLYDLGFSSYQMDESGIGMSFQKDEPLDMRLDKSLGVTAADLVNALSEKELAKLIYEYSDERFAKKFAKAIVKSRNLEKIQTTKQLAEVLVGASSSAYEHGRIHPATRTFMALRIAVNDELENLRISLPRAAHTLSSGGFLIVITFHSLEDKLAKEFGHSAQPIIKEVNQRPITPSEEEVTANIRARSAKMRVYVKEN